jgi:hypothetical protein
VAGIPSYHVETATVGRDYVAVDLELDRPTVVSPEVKELIYAAFRLEYAKRCEPTEGLDLVPAIFMARGVGHPDSRVDKFISVGAIQSCVLRK